MAKPEIKLNFEWLYFKMSGNIEEKDVQMLKEGQGQVNIHIGSKKNP